jgi:predicted ATP-grasp superfamily ATP-dependent carboligase
VLPATDWPGDLPSLAAGFPPGPWIYTGGLENYPALIEQLADRRTLYGNRGSALAAARDPFAVERVLAEAGLPGPRCERSADQLDCQAQWLRKSRRSAGGLRVQPWSVGEVASDPDDYFQQFVPGLPCAAAYVASSGRAALLGLAEQLLWGPQAAAQFHYAGSLGPMPVSPALGEQLKRLGSVLAASLGLIGLFGVDGVLADGVFWPVEINPRYTASMEIHERAGGLSMIACHIAACSCAVLPDPFDMSSLGWQAKQILFASREIRVDPRWAEWMGRQNAGAQWPVVADVPRSGTRIAAGHPLLTIFGRGDCREEAAEALERLRREADAALHLTDG